MEQATLAPESRAVPRTPSERHQTDGYARRRIAAVQAITTEGISKSEALERFKLNKNALTPGQLEPFLETSPLAAHLRVEGDLWSVTIASKGANGVSGRISARQIMAKTVESAMEVIAALGPRHGSLTPVEQRRIGFAYRTLQVAQSLGLWKDQHSSAPSELAATLPAEQDRMSAETVLADHPPEGETLTIEPEPEGDFPSSSQVDP